MEIQVVCTRSLLIQVYSGLEQNSLIIREAFALIHEILSTPTLSSVSCVSYIIYCAAKVKYTTHSIMRGFTP